MKETVPLPFDENAQLPVAGADERAGLATALVKPAAAYDALVLDAILRQSLVSVRSLGSRGLRVASLEAGNKLNSVGTTPTFSSRWNRQKYIAPSYVQSTEPYLRFLEEVLDQTRARVLITSSDGTLALVHQHREQLEKRVAIALAKDPALAIAINKDQTLAIAAQLGIAIPRGVKVDSAQDVAAAVKEIGLPAVVKPVESWLWGELQSARLTCKLVTSADEARQAVEELTRLGGSTLFQQFLTGRREAVSLLYARGEFYARFAQWASRTNPQLGGTSVLRQSIAIPPDIGEQSERLVRAIDLEGYSEIEYRRDNHGTPYLMEINPRLSASIEVAVRAGVDFPYLLYQWANGDRIDVVKGYREGGWMRYLEGDFLTTAEAVLQRGRPGVAPPTQAILAFFLSFFKPMSYDYLDWRDPLPVWTATTAFMNLLVRHLRRKGSHA
ncbi:MAG TPA: ATP-grasp domain-containing protein [Ktedonobacteraceae bacterium]|nr:ATP-grasp domain-containing protein [Ktedonobacteraceae bacterium]